MTTTENPITFADFVASKRWSDNLAADLPGEEFGDDVCKGWVYLDALHVEEVSHPGGRWFLCIANQDWLTNDLEALEKRLHRYAQAEGYTLD